MSITRSSWKVASHVGDPPAVGRPGQVHAPSVASSGRIARWKRIEVDLSVPQDLAFDMVVNPAGDGQEVPSGDHSRSVASRSGRTVTSSIGRVTIQTSLPAADHGVDGRGAVTPNATRPPSGDQTGQGGGARRRRRQ